MMDTTLSAKLLKEEQVPRLCVEIINPQVTALSLQPSFVSKIRKRLWLILPSVRGGHLVLIWLFILVVDAIERKPVGDMQFTEALNLLALKCSWTSAPDLLVVLIERGMTMAI